MGTLRNFVEAFPVEPMTVDVIRPYRNARFGAFALTIVWATRSSNAGRGPFGRSCFTGPISTPRHMTASTVQRYVKRF